MITNKEFINALFGENAQYCHVTDFSHDPSNIPKNEHLIAWKGDYFFRYRIKECTNQYFTISIFDCDEQGQARRRKALFKQTHVIVLDDVKEKLSMREVSKLPQPSWILESSKGSEQWGYILNKPCNDRSRVENLLDGLVANGLAPCGKDPGMKGVTRYVRLPEGINNKSSKLINGVPFKCKLILWNPFNRVSMEQLANPFHVDLDKSRRESRTDGAEKISDHPLINIPDLIHIKEVRSDGRFDITCPWVSEHTGLDDSGSAVFTNGDGSIGFKCHHGACQNRTGADLLKYIDYESPGFKTQLKNWRIKRDFKNIIIENIDNKPIDELQNLFDKLRKELPNTPSQRKLVEEMLKNTDNLPKIDQKYWHDLVMDVMRWSKIELKGILIDFRKEWYIKKTNDSSFYNNIVFVKELNQFYDWGSKIFYSVDAFQNSFSHEDAEARKQALQEGLVVKVDKLDFAPMKPKVFIEQDCKYANTWVEKSQSKGSPGDVSKWVDHFNILGWGDNKNHIEKWMAFTLRHPDVKINHMLLLGSGEGCGKDFLLYPLFKAMGDNYTVISGEDLLSNFNDYVLSTKYLHVNEAELGDRREAISISNKLKPLASSPPETLRVNQKGIKPIKVRNILNASMTTNSITPLKLNGPSRRFYAVWSELKLRDENDNMKKEWLDYWEDRWAWMKNGGWKAVTYHLLNHVDLSDFNPSQPPPMTEFLREIRDSSKSLMQQTVEQYIKRKHGAFKCDVLMVSDMAETLRSGVLNPADMMVEPKYFTDKRLSILLREMGCFHYVKCRDARLWIIRNDSRYTNLTQTQLYNQYDEQMKALIKSVKGC